MKDLWFQDNSQYTDAVPLPEAFYQFGSLALVRLLPNGKTETGWGAADFMENLSKGKFALQKSISYYERFKQPFAIIMRSIPYVAIDIDGKNGGVEIARVLQLPPTLAERSKSGNGYHLFYEVEGAKLDARRGYNEMEDHNGIVRGVDVRGSGVVYHYPGQKWNTLDVAPLPRSLHDLLTNAQDVRRTVRLTKNGTEALGPDELVIIHDRLRTQLEMPAKEGTRNQRLYAIGSQMYASNFPEWDREIYDRGDELGLPQDEVTGIIRNILKYSRH